jgi:hypothetical protein
MIARRLDASHDWTFGSSKANYAQKSEAIAQCIKTSLLSFRFNWFLDEDHGVNWFAYFVKNPNVPVMESDIKRHVLEVEGVQSLQDLPIQLDTVTRELIVTVKYTDIYNVQNQVGINVNNNR